MNLRHTLQSSHCSAVRLKYCSLLPNGCIYTERPTVCKRKQLTLILHYKLKAFIQINNINQVYIFKVKFKKIIFFNIHVNIWVYTHI